MALSDKILAALEQSRGTPLSGQALAERFGVSRAAVWKGVNALKSQGYAIASATNRGYTLAAACDKLSAAGVRAFLPPALAGVPVFVYERVDSTNSEARRLRAGGQTGSFIVLAEQQTAGRGDAGARLGRHRRPAFRRNPGDGGGDRHPRAGPGSARPRPDRDHSVEGVARVVLPEVRPLQLCALHGRPFTSSRQVTPLESARRIGSSMSGIESRLCSTL